MWQYARLASRDQPAANASDGGFDWRWPDDASGPRCVGHNHGDALPFTMADLTGRAPNVTSAFLTNAELVAHLDPARLEFPAVYDTYEWDACEPAWFAP